jgi:biotin-dependent carboxylase uncharacterized domain
MGAIARMPGIVVRRPGLVCTVQDSGRIGFQSSGVAPSGALDLRSLAIANILVGNPAREAGLEMSLLGPELAIATGNVFAVAGADMDARLNGRPLPRCAAFAAQRGDILSFGATRSGCRAYLAAAGGFDLPLVMGSKSTNLKCGIGGFEGRALKAGDELFFAAPAAPLDPAPRSRVEPEDFASDIVELRVIPGPQDEYFTEAGIATFYGSTYILSDRSDRMGCVLEGPAVEAIAKTDIVSDGIALGSVQIPSEGKPIVMLADRQTTGGYAKIATVISADIGKLAQRRPGDKLRFRRASLGEARRAALRDIAEHAALGRGIADSRNDK